MVTLTIDGKEIQVAEGTPLLDAITEAGIQVPTLCFHPELERWGGCRLCTVELSRNGRSTITASCTAPAEDGLVVRTDTPRVLASRKMMAELLLARTPNVPAIQRVAASLGVESPPRFDTATPEETCIVCGRCVRACHEIAGKDVLGFIERGPERRVSMAFEAYNAAVCDDCNQCIPYCPTGAITQLENLPIGRRWYEHARGWIRKRQTVQYGLLAVFAFFLATTSQKWWASFDLVNLFSRLDPLQAIAASIASRQFIFLYLPALLTIAATVAFGRVWCGWVCPLGAILDLFGPNGTRKMQGWFRQVKYGILFVILLMAAFGSLAFMFFDPITILVRGVADPFRVGMSLFKSPGFRVMTLLSMVPLLAILWLNRIEKRFWCRYLCPLGAIVGLGSKFAFLRRRVAVSCVKCGECAKACTMGAIHPGTIENDPAECVMCLDCAAPCPMTAITFERQPLPAMKTLEYNPERRGFIGSAATSAAGLVLFNTGLARAESADLLRPPGVSTKEQAFLAECIRCGQCVQACPGNALHPVSFGMSLDSFWTPALMPALGGCQWDCNRCGQVCPSGAIPNLALEEKRKQLIGLAVVDEELCINCMVCEKACPAKAIGRVEIRKGGNRKPLPVVDAEKCNGCGQCEYVCPARPSIKTYQVTKAPKMRQLERI